MFARVYLLVKRIIVLYLSGLFQNISHSVYMCAFLCLLNTLGPSLFLYISLHLSTKVFRFQYGIICNNFYFYVFWVLAGKREAHIMQQYSK